MIDSLSFQAFPSQQRILNCLRKVQDFIVCPSCSANAWISLLGTLSSIEKFVPLGRLHTSVLQFYLKANWLWKLFSDSFIFNITPEIKEDLRWWLVKDKFVTGKSLAPMNPDLTLYPDALDLGWGALLNGVEVSGTWSPTKRNLHINVKERLFILHFSIL